METGTTGERNDKLANGVEGEGEAGTSGKEGCVCVGVACSPGTVDIWGKRDGNEADEVEGTGGGGIFRESESKRIGRGMSEQTRHANGKRTCVDVHLVHLIRAHGAP